MPFKKGNSGRPKGAVNKTTATAKQEVKAVVVPLSSIKPNPSNPRTLRDEKFLKLRKSLEDFPDMLNYRAIVAVTDTDGKYMVLGGNMRLRALQDLKVKDVPVMLADHWTEEQRREFIIKDNVGFGEWDWDALANEWDAAELGEWGLDLPDVAEEDTDHSSAPPSDELFKPYSIINRQADGWPDRSNMLRAMLPEDMGRNDGLASDIDRLSEHFKDWSGNETGTSIFDPCISEWCYTMFKPSSVLDPFCGGPSRGYVAAMMGIRYKGFDVRAEQLDVNRQRIDQFATQPNYVLSCYSKYKDSDTYDMIMTCPPYGDLEVYSELKDDISNKSPEQFADAYRAIINKAWSALNVGGHACIVVGNYRRKKVHIDLEVLTKSIIMDCGGDIIGDCIIVDPIGSKAMIGKSHLERYGLITRCHQYLVIARKNKVKAT